MNNAQMLAALIALPDPDYMHATKITDPLGVGTSYSARTVVKLLQAERERCCRVVCVQAGSDEIARRTIAAIRAGDDFYGIDDLALSAP